MWACTGPRGEGPGSLSRRRSWPLVSCSLSCPGGRHGTDSPGQALWVWAGRGIMIVAVAGQGSPSTQEGLAASVEGLVGHGPRAVLRELCDSTGAQHWATRQRSALRPMQAHVPRACPPAGSSGSSVPEPIKCTCSQNASCLCVCLPTPLGGASLCPGWALGEAKGEASEGRPLTSFSLWTPCS